MVSAYVHSWYGVLRDGHGAILPRILYFTLDDGRVPPLIVEAGFKEDVGGLGAGVGGSGAVLSMTSLLQEGRRVGGGRRRVRDCE